MRASDCWRTVTWPKLLLVQPNALACLPMMLIAGELFMC